MTKVTLANVGSLVDVTTAQTTINSNSAAIVTAVENTLSRDGTSPNQMGANLDMNSNRVVNLPAPISDLEPVRVVDLTGGSVVTVNNLPTGGTVRQVLAKNSGTNYDVVWNSSGVPNGGTTSQVLRKNSNTDYDTTWFTLPTNVTTIAGNTGAFTLGVGLTNNVNDIKLGSGTIIGTGIATSAANSSLSVAIPADDTIPQSTEGTQVLSLVYTPKASTSTLIVRFDTMVSADSANNVTAAMFNGSSNAFAAQLVNIASPNLRSTISFTGSYAPGTVSPQTITVRVGANSGNAAINGIPGGRLLGGASFATLRVDEIAA